MATEQNLKRPDLTSRIHTAKHELSHGLVSYAVQSQDIQIKVFKRPIGMESGGRRLSTMKCMGVCSQRYRLPQHGIFITAGPFSSPIYRVDDDDQIEFVQLVAKYKKMTGLPVGTFRSFVLDPLKALLESDPVLKIIDRLAPVLAEGGCIRAKNYKGLEKFFPKDLSMPMLEAMCRHVREAAEDYPFVK